MKISFCGTAKEDEYLDETIKSIKNQSVKPDEVIVTNGKNIAIGRNSYLKKAKGDIIFTFDSGCTYEKDYIKKMLERFKKSRADIVMGITLPAICEYEWTPLIWEFCATRMPQYFRFTEKDWNNFIPSNKQVAFKKSVIKKLGLLPENLERADDTYWFQLAKKKRLKFAHCEAKVFWNMKSSIKDYLSTVYKDNKINKKYKIKTYPVKKISPLVFPYGTVVSFLAMIVKLWSKL